MNQMFIKYSTKTHKIPIYDLITKNKMIQIILSQLWGNFSQVR